MAIIRTLTLVFSGDTKKLSKSTQKVVGTLDNLDKKIGKSVGNLLKYSAAATTAAAVGLTVLINRQRGAIDRFGKLSDELGISTEALIGFDHAARITGTSTEAMEKGLQILVRRIGEAEQGFGEGVKGFSLLGLKAEELSKMPLEQAIREVSDAMRRLPSQSKVAAAAFALMGRRGVDLINFFDLGTEGMDQMQAMAEKLGLTLSRETVFGVEEANDALEELQGSMAGFINRLTGALAPVLGLFADTVTEAMTGSKASVDGLQESIKFVSLGIAAWADHLKGVIGLLLKAFGLLNLIPQVGAITDLFDPDGTGRRAMDNLAEGLLKSSGEGKLHAATVKFLAKAERETAERFKGKQADLESRKDRREAKPIVGRVRQVVGALFKGATSGVVSDRIERLITLQNKISERKEKLQKEANKIALKQLKRENAGFAATLGP